LRETMAWTNGFGRGASGSSILHDHDDTPGPGRETFPLEIRREIVSGLGEAIRDPTLMRITFVHHQDRFRNVQTLVPTHRKLSGARTEEPRQFSKHFSSLRQTERENPAGSLTLRGLSGRSIKIDR
ncbi:MAG: hypothetical protein M1532_04135, partial [Nitrospirae bacterium]|nr:hypothetical protein [Nitrospirota bacterium]